LAVVAHTTATSAIEPFVIHILVPLSTQPPRSRRAVVRIPEGSLPESGSVSPKQPIASPAAIAGSQRCFRCSLPWRWIARQLACELKTREVGHGVADQSFLV
jgi:hypothetical protein